MNYQIIPIRSDPIIIEVFKACFGLDDALLRFLFNVLVLVCMYVCVHVGVYVHMPMIKVSVHFGVWKVYKDENQGQVTCPLPNVQ